MVAVLTGDIMASRKGQVQEWLTDLKKVLGYYGKTPLQWEIFRGDSFQLLLMPEQALEAAFHIKSIIKQSHKHDVRIAIGLGEIAYHAARITESNGTAFVHSGQTFDALKKQTLQLKSDFSEHDKCINLMLSLALLTANNWSKTVAEAVSASIEHPAKNQNEIAKLLNKKSQSTVSEALKRGGFEEIMNVNKYYKQNFPFK